MKHVLSVICVLLACQSLVMASGEDKRKSIALGAFKWAAPSSGLKGRKSSDIINSLHTRIKTALTQCRKYSIVERKQMGQLLEELELMNDTDLVNPNAIKNSPKWGMFHGIHWLVIGTITNFSDDVSGVGGTTVGGASKRTLLLEIDLRILEVETAKILTAQSVMTRVNLDYNMISKETGVAQGKSSAGLKESQLLRETAHNIVQEIVAATIPIEVIGLSNKEAVINYGSGLLNPGDRLVIYRPGETFYDEYTGMSETEMIEAGRLEITTAQNIISKAKVIGKSSGVSKGDICRLAKQAYDKPRNKKGGLKNRFNRLFGRN